MIPEESLATHRSHGTSSKRVKRNFLICPGKVYWLFTSPGLCALFHDVQDFIVLWYTSSTLCWYKKLFFVYTVWVKFITLCRIIICDKVTLFFICYFLPRKRNITWEPDKYYPSWCPGRLRLRIISRHDIYPLRCMNKRVFFFLGRISRTISLEGYYQDTKHIYDSLKYFIM